MEGGSAGLSHPLPAQGAVCLPRGQQAWSRDVRARHGQGGSDGIASPEVGSAARLPAGAARG